MNSFQNNITNKDKDEIWERIIAAVGGNAESPRMKATRKKWKKLEE